MPMLPVLLLSLLSTAYAADGDKKEDEKKYPSVKPGMLVYGQWGMNLSEGANGANAFDLTRAYFFAKADLSNTVAMRITLDADRQKAQTLTLTNADGTTTDYTVAADPKMRVFVKHAYAEWKAAEGIKLRAGMTDTAWTSMYDGFVNTRYLFKSPADANKFVSTADLGLQVHGEHAKGLVNWQAGVINGEGFANPEIDASKTIQARVTIDPLAGKEKKMGLPISAFFSQDVGGEGEPVTLYSGAVGFKMPALAAWAEYDGKSQAGEGSSIISATVVPKIPKVMYFVARFDRFDASSADGDEAMTIVGGVGKDFMDKVSAAATFERTSVGDAATQGLYLKMQAGF